LCNDLRADVVVRNFQIIEREPTPAFRLRAEPGVHEGHASSTHRMRFHTGCRTQRRSVKAGFIRGAIEFGARDTADDERAAIEFLTSRFEWLFGGLHIDVAKFVAQRGQRGLSAVVDGENSAFALYA